MLNSQFQPIFWYTVKLNICSIQSQALPVCLPFYLLDSDFDPGYVLDRHVNNIQLTKNKNKEFTCQNSYKYNNTKYPRIHGDSAARTELI